MSRGNEESVFAEERKHLIVELVNKQVKTTVAQLCDEFKVSPATVRNDLRELEFAGLLKRTHGGAISNRKTNYEPTFYEKLVERIDEKRAIAEAAAAMVQDGDTVAIDSGTTTLELAKHLTHVQNLTVVTYDLQVATFLERNSQATIILMGGILRRDLFYTSGPMTITALQGLNVDRVFLSTNGVAAGKGVTSPNMAPAEAQRERSRSAAPSAVSRRRARSIRTPWFRRSLFPFIRRRFRQTPPFTWKSRTTRSTLRRCG